jgi:ParB family chromosome partitioning protein
MSWFGYMVFGNNGEGPLVPEVISVDPFRCRMWSGHERLEKSISAENCRDEIDSFMRHGQKFCVLGRPVHGDATCDYELVYGARRLFVARHLNVLLSIEVRELDDRDAIVAIDIENRQRKELSPYERGRAYRMWIREGIAESQDELARMLNVSASQVSRLIHLAELPAEICDAFADPVEICESWGRLLMELWQEPVKREALLRAARSLAKESLRRPAAAVFRRLVAAAGQASTAASVRLPTRDEVVKDAAGSPLFRIKRHRTATALLLPTSAVPSRVLAEIIREVGEILQRAKAQALDPPMTRSKPLQPQATLPGKYASSDRELHGS